MKKSWKGKEITKPSIISFLKVDVYDKSGLSFFQSTKMLREGNKLMNKKELLFETCLVIFLNGMCKLDLS